MACSLATRICTSIIATCSIFCALFVVYHIWHFISALCAGKLGEDKFHFALSSIYFSITLIAIISCSVVNWCSCIKSNLSEQIFDFFYNAGAVCYGLQYSILIFLLFQRLCIIFERTSFEISLPTRVTFVIIYICFISLAIIVQIQTITKSINQGPTS